MKTNSPTYLTFVCLCAAVVVIFAGRTLLAAQSGAPRLFEIFDSLVVLASLLICARHWRKLRSGDYIIALLVGVVIGAGYLYSTLFSAYPFFDVVQSNLGLALVRGLITAAAMLGGLVILRLGGPVSLPAADGQWRRAAGGIGLGLVVGLPLAVVNVFALQATQGRGVDWQNPLAAMLDPLQPALLEEAVYRFALWGLLWLVLRSTLGEKAPFLAGLVATLIHAYAHLGDLFVEAPLAALGMGLVMALLWGLPPLLLARRRGLGSAVAFHWIQDAARFWAGF